MQSRVHAHVPVTPLPVDRQTYRCANGWQRRAFIDDVCDVATLAVTGVDNLRDESSGRLYLMALRDTERADLLARLWRAGGFEGPDP